MNILKKLKVKMKIKSFNQFLNEEISGTELVGPVGPAFGETRLQNKTVNSHNTNVILCDLDNKFYTIDEYNNSYNDYLSSGGKPLPDGFNRENLNTIVEFLSGN
jgi:hypothetical protein